MAARQRKTLVVCRKHHEDIQYGRCSWRTVAKFDTGELGQETRHTQFGGGPTEKDCLTSTSPAAYPTARPVRREAVGKGPSHGTSPAAHPTATAATPWSASSTDTPRHCAPVTLVAVSRSEPGQTGAPAGAVRKGGAAPWRGLVNHRHRRRARSQSGYPPQVCAE
jgi:hypothetical protein